MHDKELLVTFFNTKFLCAEVNFNLDELGRTCQYLAEDQDAHVKRFHETPLDRCDPVAKEVLVDVCLHGIRWKNTKYPEEHVFLFLL